MSAAANSVISSDGLGELLDELCVARAGVHDAAVAESEEEIGADVSVSVCLNIDGVINPPCRGQVPVGSSSTYNVGGACLSTP